MLLRWWQVCLLLLLVLPLNGQQADSYTLQQRRINASDGLSAEAIQDVFRDSVGFYWIADLHTLFSFDGQRFKKYDYQDLGILANDFLAFWQDEEGLIWIATQHGQNNQLPRGKSGLYSELKIFNPYSKDIWSAERIEELLPCELDDIWRLSSDGKHLFLITIRGEIYQYERGRFHFLYHEKNAYPILSVTWSPHTQKYYWASMSDLYEWDGKGVSRFSQKLSFRGFNLTVQEDILMVSIQQGKNVLPSQVELLALNPDTPPRPIANFPETLLIGSGQQDSIWLSNKAGNQLFIRCKQDGQINVCPSTIIKSSLGVKSTFATGAAKFDDTFCLLFPRLLLAMKVEPHGVETIQWGGMQSVRDIAQVSDSLLLMTTYGGAKRVNLTTRAVTPTLPEIGQGGFAIHDEDDHLLIGRHNFSFLQVQKTPWIAGNRFVGKSFDNIRSSALQPVEDEYENIWIGTSSGLLFYATKEELVRPFFDSASTALNLAMISQIVPDEEGIWVSSTSGTFLLDPKDQHIIDSFALSEERLFQSVVPLSEDSIWLVPKAGNPVLWERSSERLTYLDIYRPNLGNNLHTILRDKTGAYWLPSNNGLYRYDPQNGRVIQLLEEEYGLPNNEFNRMAWEVLRDGRIALGTVDGFCIIDPEVFASTKNIVAPIQITEAAYSQVGEDEITFVQLSDELVPSLPSNLRRLSLQFAQLSPFQRKLRYYYRLDTDGVDTEWELLPEAELTLERLSSGKHVLELAVKGEFDQRFQALTAWSFTIQNHWYQQPWFYGLLVILTYLLLSRYLRYRLAMANARHYELEKLVQERTAELEKERSLITSQNEKLQRMDRAKDRLYALITHEIKGPLLGVLGLSKKIDFLLRKNRPEDIKMLSRKIDQNARQVSLLLDNMISWGKMQFDDQQPISRESVNISAELQQIIGELKELAERKNLEFGVEIDAAEVIWFDRQAFWVIMRNLLHNAVKFSHLEQAIIIKSCSAAGNTTTITVLNTGLELPEDLQAKLEGRENIVAQRGTAKEQGSGIGLRLCTELARRNDAKLKFVSLDNQQTQVQLLAPTHPIQ